MRPFSCIVIVIATFVLALPLDAKMSTKLNKFMAKSGVGKHCKSQGMTDEQCIMYLKKLCGMQDVSNPVENAELDACTDREVCGRGIVPESDKANRTVRQKLEFSWDKKHLSYYVYNTPPQTTLSKSEIVTMTHEAFAVWSCYTELTFNKARSMSDADLIVFFSEPTHEYYSIDKDVMNGGSDGSPFDGEGGTLAHAFYPIGDVRGNLHMDNAEYWSANMHSGAINTFYVLVHELGHALGLPHSESKQDIMTPYYSGRVREAELDLGPWEKSAIRSFYGSKSCRNKSWQTYFNQIYPKKDTGKDPYKPRRPKKPNTGSDPERCELIHSSACDSSPWVKENCKTKCSGHSGSSGKPDAKKCSRYHPDNCKNSPWLRQNCPSVCSRFRRSDAKEIDCDLYHPDNCETSETFRTSCPQVCENAKRSDAKEIDCDLYHPDNCETSETFRTSCPQVCENAKRSDNEKCAIYHPDNCKLSEWFRTNCQDTCTNAHKRAVSGNKAHVCKKGSLHSIFDFVDGFTYIISDGFLYRRNNAAGHVDMSFRRKVKSLWKGAPAKPSAAVYSRAAKRLFLFEGKDVFVVNGVKSGNVKRITVHDPKYPSSPSAAFVKFDDRDSGNVYLVKGDRVFVLSTSKRKIVKSFAFKDLFEVGRYVKRIPRKVDGAYHLFSADKDHNPADSLFFFTGSSYTVAIPDAKTGKYNIPSGTAAFSTSYLHCPQQ